MIETLALAVVVLAALYLMGLAVMSFLAPAQARRFLKGFAGSARAHFIEMAIRIVVGCSFLVCAHRMLYPMAFQLFGWVLVVTTAILLLFPWRWHHRFAERVVPPITRRVWLLGMVSLQLGGIILFAVLHGTSA